MPITHAANSYLHHITGAGAPYSPGDPITIAIDGSWHEGTVWSLAPVLGVTHFGQRWMLTVHHDGDQTVMVTCDDNGLNNQVRPSDMVRA